MELLLALVALVLGAAALGLAIQLRGVVSALEERIDPALRELDRLRAELSELRTVPAPPLPKARPRLDDLREQLRAAHQAEAEGEEETAV
jgi:hypothetical protein